MKYFTKQWYETCQRPPWDRAAKEHTERISNEYQSYYKTVEPFLSASLKNLSLHDCRIKAYEFVGKDLHMTIDSKNGFCKVEQVVFVRANILECELDLTDAWWLFEEIYLVSDGYEMRVLLSVNANTLATFHVRFDELLVQ